MNGPSDSIDPTFVTTLRTRGYEIGADGFIRPALYLRYCEHVRWVALSATDEVEALFADGAAMFVVAQKLALARDVGYDAALTASFAVGRLGRTSVDFHQQISLADTGQPVAAARITAVYVGPNGRPAPLPELMRRRHAPGATLALEVPDALPPEADARNGQGFSIALTVRPSDADLLGHVNHAKHVDYLDDARQLGAAEGVAGLAGRLRGVAIDYLKEARPGERVRAELWPLEPDHEGRAQVGCALRGAADGEPLTRARLVVGSA